MSSFRLYSYTTMALYLIWYNPIYVYSKNLIFNCSRYERNTCLLDTLKLDVENLDDVFPNHKKYPNNGESEYNLIDNDRRIMMTTTPKAACTKSAMIFLESMGYVYRKHYTHTHIFKKEYEKQCGNGTPCLLLDKSWFKFKIVRNPFDRAVSSYIELMKGESYPMNNLKNPYKIIKHKGKGNISFHMLIDILLSRANGFWDFDCAFHVEKQISRLEKLFWSRNEKSPYNFVFKSEDFKSGWAEISRLTNYTYTINEDMPLHIVKRRNGTSYVGDIPFGQLVIPINYGLFYNDIVKEKVARLFHDDIIIYNYSFPF
mmetsp:Transcript_6848/g.6952  ORF Transcript_6848/g.6952 Transcript_6848/m.6952 type:complete len:315 (+) Transcript_6848:93-1037(+)